jgi:chromosome segregation ATPase
MKDLETRLQEQIANNRKNIQDLRDKIQEHEQLIEAHRKRITTAEDDIKLLAFTTDALCGILNTTDLGEMSQDEVAEYKEDIPPTNLQTRIQVILRQENDTISSTDLARALMQVYDEYQEVIDFNKMVSKELKALRRNKVPWLVTIIDPEKHNSYKYRFKE